MSKNRISRCLWLQAKLRLDSPAAIGSGNASHTDRDVPSGGIDCRNREKPPSGG